jgi:hypothetical protein
VDAGAVIVGGSSVECVGAVSRVARHPLGGCAPRPHYEAPRQITRGFPSVRGADDPCVGWGSLVPALTRMDKNLALEWVVCEDCIHEGAG